MFTILCPTDFSEAANNAVLYASEIAKNLHGRLHLTHIVHPTYVAVDSNGLFMADVGLEEQQEASNERLDKLAKELTTNDITVTVSTEYGFWDTALSDLKEKVKPDLLVSGTQGAGSVFSAKFFGMNTMDMIQRIDCPVLVVPPHYKFSQMEQIVYATDYQFEDIDHAEFVVKLAKITSASMSFVHVSANPKEAKNDQVVMDWFKEMLEQQVKYPKTNYSLLVNQDTDKALERFVTDTEVDLLCVSMRHKSVLQQLFSHSHTYKFVADAVVPVLVFHLHDNFRL